MTYEIKSPARLESFLYILGRDHLPLGVVEKILRDHVESTGDNNLVFTNEDLAKWAQRVAKRLAWYPIMGASE